MERQSIASLSRAVPNGEELVKTVHSMLAEAEAEVPSIRPQEARELLGRTDVLFLDVRETNEVAKTGRVRGAMVVPRGLLEFGGQRP
jgi:predicted sulfurtransferase